MRAAVRTRAAVGGMLAMASLRSFMTCGVRVLALVTRPLPAAVARFMQRSSYTLKSAKGRLPLVSRYGMLMSSGSVRLWKAASFRAWPSAVMWR